MKDLLEHTTRLAKPDDAEDLARLIDIAGEGIPSWLWAKSADVGQSPLDFGISRARRETGGFSYKNALIAERSGDVLGMVLSYPIDAAAAEDADDLPPPIAPFVVLEAQSVGTWYVNALAVRAGAQGGGIGCALLEAAEEQAAEAGYSKLSIQVYAQNTGAVRLYHRLGFKTVSRSPVLMHPCQPYYTGDVLLLLKPIRARAGLSPVSIKG